MTVHQKGKLAKELKFLKSLSRCSMITRKCNMIDIQCYQYTQSVDLPLWYTMAWLIVYMRHRN